MLSTYTFSFRFENASKCSIFFFIFAIIACCDLWVLDFCRNFLNGVVGNFHGREEIYLMLSFYCLSAVRLATERLDWDLYHIFKIILGKWCMLVVWLWLLNIGLSTSATWFECAFQSMCSYLTKLLIRFNFALRSRQWSDDSFI